MNQKQKPVQPNFTSSTHAKAKVFADGMKSGASQTPIFTPGKFKPLLSAVPIVNANTVFFEPNVKALAETLEPVLQTIESSSAYRAYQGHTALVGVDDAEAILVQSRGSAIYTVAQQLVESRVATNQPKGDFGLVDKPKFTHVECVRTITSQIGSSQKDGNIFLPYGGDDTIVSTMATAHRVFNAPDRNEASRRTTTYWLPRKRGDRMTRFIIATNICKLVKQNANLNNAIKWTPAYLADRMFKANAARPQLWDAVVAEIAELADIAYLFAPPDVNHPDTVAGWLADLPDLIGVIPELDIHNPVVDDFAWEFSWKSAYSEDSATYSRYEHILESMFQTTTVQNYKNTPGSTAIISHVQTFEGMNSISAFNAFDNSTGSLACVTDLQTNFDPGLPLTFKSMAVCLAAYELVEWVLSFVKLK